MEIAESLGLPDLLKRKTVNLSGGERQRVALARALAPGNSYLLLDEPLSALHEGMKKELWFLLRELQEQYRFTILMVSHDLEETFFLADTVSVMIDGRIRQTGEKNTVYHRPATGEIADFFGIKNLFKAEVRDGDGNFVTLHCPELGALLKAPAATFDVPTAGAAIEVGIRAEEVMILRDGCRERARDNVLLGVITDIFEKGASHTVLFKPEGAVRKIEIEVPHYAFRKLGIEKNGEAAVALKEESLFFLEHEPDMKKT